VSPGFRNRNAQRGLAMLALVAIVVMGSLYWLISGLAQPANRTAPKRAQNAKVLQDAKTALIGYVAIQTAKGGENDPGSLPCPESPANVGNPTQEGIAAPNCLPLPAVGRLPWRTLGIDKPLDAASEPLWYVVSPGWHKPNSMSNTVINSNTPGQIAVDGIEAVAVIIAPGERLNIPASANCVARNQARNVPSPAIDFRDYLDCHNATPADFTFTSSDPVGPFNDQVLAVTTVEILPVIEAAVAQRFERQIAPQIVGAYSNIDGTNSAWPTTGSVLPFAAPLTDPTTSNLKGTRTTAGLATTGTYQGLLPLNRVRTRCTPAPPLTECTPAPCTPGANCDSSTAFIRWSGPATMSGPPGPPEFYAPNCTVGAAQIDCTFHVIVPLLGAPPASVNFTVTATADNVGMGFRQLQTNVPMPGVLSAGRSAQGALTANGAATITLTGQADTSDLGGGGLLGLVVNTVCGLPLVSLLLGCAKDTISIPISMIVDHPLTDPNDDTYNWFLRNKWHEVTYYAVAPSVAPSGTGVCTTGVDCLTVNYRSPSNTYRGLLAFGGRRLSTTVPSQTRPATSVGDLFEGANNAVGNATPLAPFAARDPTLMVGRTFNDRIAVIDNN
jgi:hypothetical protein